MIRNFLLFCFLFIHLSAFSQVDQYEVIQSETNNWYIIESIGNRDYSKDEIHVPEDCYTTLVDDYVDFKRDFAQYFTVEELEIFRDIQLIGAMSFNDQGKVEQIKFLTKKAPTPAMKYFSRLEELYKAKVDMTETPCKNIEGKVFTLHEPLYIKENSSNEYPIAHQSMDPIASFPGGREKLDIYFRENMQWNQSQLTVVGKVFVSLLVEKDGSISNVAVVRGLCESCDKEAVRLVKNMPIWIPAKKDEFMIESKVFVFVEFEL